MRVADYLIQRLESAGISHAFVVSGGGAAFLDDALRLAKRMRYVCCHHEQAATMAAEAYARARCGLGLAVVTSGPGATNAVTGIAGAWADSVPLVVVSGQVFSTQTVGTRPGRLRTLGVQEIDIAPVAEPVTKCAVQVTDPRTIRFHVERALHLAVSGRPGPVLLDVPADVQNADVDPEALEGFREPSGAIVTASRAEHERRLRDDVRGVLRLLSGARRPLLHVGQGVRLARAEDVLEAFLGAAGMPVVTARNANDMIDSEHPLYVGRPGTFAQRGANFAVQTCDVYLAVGTRLSLAQTGYNAKDYARGARVVQVDVDLAELNKGTVPLAMRVQADAGDFLRELLLQMGLFRGGLPDWSGWLARCKGLQRRYPPVTDDQRRQERGVNSYALVDVLSDLAEPDDVVVTDVGFAFQNTHQAWRVKRGQRVLSNCGLAAMGWGLPAAVGAAVGTGRRVICLTGDGGLMFNSQELATIAHHKLPVKIFLLNNGGYLTMRQSQDHAFGAVMGSDRDSGVSFPDFTALADAYGVPSVRINRHSNVANMASNVLEGPGPVFCEVMMDPDQAQVPKSVNRRLADGTIQQTVLEDAHPFLDPAEVAANLDHNAAENG